MYIPRLADGLVAENIAGSKKILMILGARQVGKTTLIKKALEGKNFAHFNFDIAIDKERFLAAGTLSPQDAQSYLGNPDYLVHRIAEVRPRQFL